MAHLCAKFQITKFPCYQDNYERIIRKCPKIAISAFSGFTNRRSWMRVVCHRLAALQLFRKRGNEITFVYFEKWDTEILVFLLLLVDEQFNTLELLTEKTCFNPFVSSGLPIQSHTWTNVFVSERGHQYALQCTDAVAAPRSAALISPQCVLSIVTFTPV